MAPSKGKQNRFYEPLQDMHAEPSPHVYALPNAPFSDFYVNLSRDSELKAIADEALDALKEDKFAGTAIPKERIPKTYLREYGVTNLYKMNLRKNYRLTYTLIGSKEGVCPHVIEVMTHREYLKRFGYKVR